MSKVAGQASIEAIKSWSEGKFTQSEVLDTDPGAGSVTSAGMITFVVA